MIRLFVDHREIPSPPPGMDSLDQVLKHVEQAHLSPDCVIRQVTVNGIPVVCESFQTDEPGGKGKAASLGTIEISTAAIGDIARESIQEALSYIDRVEAAVPTLAASFQSPPGPEAFENLRQLYEGFYWLYHLLYRLNALLNGNTGKDQPEAASIKAHQDRFLGNLQHMVEAHELHDFALLADLLEYEIIPLIPDLKQHFLDMAVKAEQRE